MEFGDDEIEKKLKEIERSQMESPKKYKITTDGVNVSVEHLDDI